MRLSLMILVSGLLVFGVIGACSSSSSPGSSSKPGVTTKPPSPSPPAKPDLTIFLMAEMKGSTEPCGCTADPLGDLARTSRLVKEARAKGPVLVFDGGSTLYTQVEIGERSLAQEVLKSDLIVKALLGELKVDAIGLGPYDFGEGLARVRPPRLATNIAPNPELALQAPKIITAGGIKVGVFAVVGAKALVGLPVEVGDVVSAANKAVADLRAQGAHVIVSLAHMTKEEARAMAKAAPGMDFVLISQNTPEPKDVRQEPMQIGDTWLFMPANRGQVVSRVHLWRRGEGAWADAIGDVRAKYETKRVRIELAELRVALKKWEGDPTADKAFVAGKRAEADTLVARQATLRTSPIQPPESGNYFTLAQVQINKGLACDSKLVATKLAYDKASGLANVKAAADKKPAPAAKGAASYVGIEECGMCHQEAVDFWKNTNHAKAWETLEGLGKEFNYDCIGCHVTGFDKPGGSNIAFNDELRDVQCEQCHGPGSIHVDTEGNSKVPSIVRRPEESVCLGCHTQEHSDTFDFDAYLRDITGPGHGLNFRNTLGKGETGESLRAAALKKAGLSVGANCPK